jgi:hypothetical protein
LPGNAGHVLRIALREKFAPRISKVIALISTDSVAVVWLLRHIAASCGIGPA